MSASHRPRRSVLYMPGSNARALEKAKSLSADAVILDLEDAVAPDAKETARDQVCAAVKAGGYGRREVIIRVNALESPWGLDDLKAASEAGPDAILVPKVNSSHDVKQYEAVINDAGAPADLGLWAMMETPLAMLNAHEIAASAKEPGARLCAWVMGTNDIAKEAGMAQTQDRIPFLYSLEVCVLAAKAYGLGIMDGVYNDFKNESGFEDICRQGLELGFDGKTLIHPSQIGPCNDIFSPSDDEVAWSRKIIAAFDEPENQNKGAIQVDGKMVERLHADIAARTVAIAEAISDLANDTPE